MLENKRIGHLDGLRGIAVLIVFMSHTSGRDMCIHPALNFAGIGHVGVYLFFCLSAFLLASKLFEEGIDWNGAKRFYIKRFFRIIPLYFLVITGVFIAQYFFGHYNQSYLHIKNGSDGFVQHLLLYRGDGVFWSVVVEEQFYLLVPLWMFLIVKYRLKALIVFIIIALINFGLYMCKYLQFPLDVDWIKYITTNDRSSGNYIDIFIFTIVLLYFFHYYKSFFEKNIKKVAIIANILFFGLMALTLICVSQKLLIFNQPFYNLRYISLLYTVVFALFIISVKNGNPVNSLLNNIVLRKFGVYGFSVYLLHMLVFELINHTDIIPPVKFVLSAGSIFALSAVTYYLIEKPSISFSYHLINKFKLNKHD